MPDTQYCSGGSRGFSQPAAALGFACAAACFGRDHDCARLSQGMGRVSSSHGVRGLARPSWMDGVSFRGDGILWRDRDCAGIVHAFFFLAAFFLVAMKYFLRLNDLFSQGSTGPLDARATQLVV